MHGMREIEMMLPRGQILRAAVLFFATIAMAVLMWRPSFVTMSEIMRMLLIVVVVGLVVYLCIQLYLDFFQKM